MLLKNFSNPPNSNYGLKGVWWPAHENCFQGWGFEMKNKKQVADCQNDGAHNGFGKCLKSSNVIISNGKITNDFSSSLKSNV